MRPIIFLCFLAALLFASSSYAATYYVSKSGGGSECVLNNPCLSLVTGLSKLASGDTLVIGAGTYTETSIGPNNAQIPNGTSSAPTTVRGAGMGSTIFKPSTCSAQGDAISLYNRSYITIKDFTVDGVNCTTSGGMQGIRLADSSHHIVIENMEVKNTVSNAIGMAYTLLHSNTVRGCVLHNWGQNLHVGQYPYGIYISGDGNLVENNEIYNGGGWGIHHYPASSNNIFRGNYIHDTHDLGAITFRGTNNQVYNNVLANGNFNGIYMASCSGCKVFNNTVYGFGSDSSMGTVAAIYLNSGSSVQIRNNIVYANASNSIHNGGTGSTVTNNKTDNPLFVSASTGNFQLQSTSTAIDQGATLTEVTTDFNGTPRPQPSGGAYDIGAYEFLATPDVDGIRIVASSDDAEESTVTGIMDLTSSDLEFVEDTGVGQVVGLRFLNVEIPQGYSIDSASIQFTVDEIDSVTTNLVIRGHDVDNATTFTNVDDNISTRAVTSASVNWSPTTWSAGGLAGADQKTPDLSSVIQEIVNRPGWVSGNAMAFIITGSGARVAESYDGVAASAPLLDFEYSASVPDTTDPTIPQNLVATAIDPDEISIVWDLSTDAGSTPFYRLERCQGAGCSTWSEIATPMSNSYTDSGLTPGITYAYRVRAEDDVGNQSEYGNTDEVATPSDTSDPSVPIGLSAISESANLVELSWSPSTDNVATPITYRIERCQGESCTSWSEIDTTTLLMHDDTTVSEGIWYRYRVRAGDVSNNLSGYSDIVDVVVFFYAIGFASNPTNLSDDNPASPLFAGLPTNLSDDNPASPLFAGLPTLHTWTLLFTRNDTTHDCANTYIGASPMGNANHLFDDFGGGTSDGPASDFPLTTVLDEFDRADENPIGSPWVNGITGTGSCQIINGVLGRSTGTFNCYFNTQYGPNQEVFTTLPNADNHGTLTNSRLYACLNPANVGTSSSEGYILRFQKQDGLDHLMIERRLTTGPEQIGAHVEKELNSGDKIGMRILEDGTISVWVNTGSEAGQSSVLFPGLPTNLGSQ